MVSARISGSVVALALFCACSVPSEQDVRAEFRRDHPSAEVLELYIGEGDSEHALYTIRYRENGVSYRACWLYRDFPDSGWHVMNKGSTPEPAPARYCS